MAYVYIAGCRKCTPCFFKFMVPGKSTLVFLAIAYGIGFTGTIIYKIVLIGKAFLIIITAAVIVVGAGPVYKL